MWLEGIELPYLIYFPAVTVHTGPGKGHYDKVSLYTQVQAVKLAVQKGILANIMHVSKEISKRHYDNIMHVSGSRELK